MSDKSKKLEWIETLGKEITSTIEWQAITNVEWYYSKADENEWGTDLLELYPEWQEIEEAGPHDGERAYAIVNHFDILEAQNVLSKVDAVAFSLNENQQPSVTLEGKYKGHEIVVIVHFAPVDDLDDEIERPCCRVRSGAGDMWAGGRRVIFVIHRIAPLSYNYQVSPAGVTSHEASQGDVGITSCRLCNLHRRFFF